jgi:hypothetical protein
MDRKNLSVFIFFFVVLFTLQIFDIPPVRNSLNPKTCCGRTICMCKHGKGAACPFRHGMAKGLDSGHQSAVNKTVSKAVPKKSCHLHQTKSSKPSQGVKSSKASERFAFTKAPCATDAPKSVLPHHSKDFLFPGSAFHFSLIQEETILSSSFDALLLLREQGIYRPPRTLSFSF